MNSRLTAILLATTATMACSPATPAPSDEAAPHQTGGLPDVVRDGETYAFVDWYGEPAPSAALPCSSEEEWRLPISGACVGPVESADLDPLIAPMELAGCAWVNTEADFGENAILFRALGCSDEVTTLDYGGGAHAAELTYVRSASHGDDFKDHVAVRISEYWDNDDYRLLETIPEDSIDFCEILPAGETSVPDAKIIVPKPGHEDADCGAYAVSDEMDNFWMIGPQYVFSFSLPGGSWDIDPTSFKIVTPE